VLIFIFTQFVLQHRNETLTLAVNPLALAAPPSTAFPEIVCLGPILPSLRTVMVSIRHA
jgi:hypothetical protein